MVTCALPRCMQYCTKPECAISREFISGTFTMAISVQLSCRAYRPECQCLDMTCGSLMECWTWGGGVHVLVAAARQSILHLFEASSLYLSNTGSYHLKTDTIILTLFEPQPNPMGIVFACKLISANHIANYCNAQLSPNSKAFTEFDLLPKSVSKGQRKTAVIPVR